MAPVHGEGQALALREGKVFFSSTVARGPVPREYSRTPVPSEGQALALREGKAFFHRIAGPVTATLSDV